MPTISKIKPGFTWLQVTIHILGWLPLVWIIYSNFAGKLSVNPIQDIERQLGHLALYFLIASLACTPFYTLSGWREPLKRRRALGLYCFIYSSLHVFTFVGLDYGFNLQLIGGIVLEKPFAIVGLATFILLLPLALTSFRGSMKRMGQKWIYLHRLVYFAGVLAIIHYAWARKGDIFRLSGDILQPLLWGLLLMILFVLRIPPIPHWVTGLRKKSSSEL